MRIAIVHGHAPAREILRRALHLKLQVEVVDFSCVEDLMLSSLEFDTFVVYNDLGHNMNGGDGVKVVRQHKPLALIIGVSNKPGGDRIFLPAGADAFLLRAGNEIQELTTLIQQKSSQRGSSMPAGG